MRNHVLVYVLKRSAIILLFFTITPITLFATVTSLLSLSKSSETVSAETTNPLADQAGQKTYIYSASNSTSSFPKVSIEVIAEDGRAEIVRSYLEKWSSPLSPYSSLLVEISDKYGLDYRLLPAIAQKESGLCRRIPEGSHNCWGWGIHSKGTLKFDNYPEALETVAKGLRENYIDKGYVTPDQIMKKYAHPDSTTWAEGVNLYMDQLE